MSNTQYLNALKISGGSETTNHETIASFGNARILFASHSGVKFSRYPDRTYFCHQLCNVNELSNWTGEFDNEQSVTHAGKNAYTVNDSISWSATLTQEALDPYTLAAMVGLPMNNASASGIELEASIRVGQNYGVKGDIIIQYGFGDNKLLAQSTLITDVAIRVIDAPGAQDGDIRYTIELTSSGNVYHAGKGTIFTPFWFENSGSVTNANAPEGSITAFNIKNANWAFPTTVPTTELALQAIDSEVSSSDSERFIKSLYMNGTKQSSSTFSVSAATGTITFDAAPAAGAKIYGVCLVPTGFDEATIGEHYGPGDIADDGGVWYRYSGTTNANGKKISALPSADSGDWDSLDATFTQQIPYYSQNNAATSPHLSTTPNFPFFSWYQLMRIGN